MKSTVLRAALVVALAGGFQMSARAAESGTATGAKPLPVLLIKGEVVSLDANDPAATLLKVKDRYGFETPIYVTLEAKVTQGDKAIPLTSLTAGTTVDVEYNFDVNTAKRHAVSVKVAQAPAVTTAQASATATVPTPAAVAIPAAASAPMPPAPAVKPAETSAPSAAPAAATPTASSQSPAAPAKQ